MTFGSVTSDEKHFAMREMHTPRYVHPELKNDDNCVLTMVRFAQDMLIIMQDIAMQNIYEGHGCSLRGQLQIGECAPPSALLELTYCRQASLTVPSWLVLWA